MPFSICNAAERSTLWPGALKRALAWPVSQPTARRGWQFAAFRDWKAREHLRAAYEIAPRVWRSESLARVADKSAAERVVWKNCEPCFTGLAYTERHIYLTLAVGALEPAAAGRLLYLADLFRRDPDYADHRNKRTHLVMLARTASQSVTDFARRRRIRVVLVGSNALATNSGREV